jgi:hypothetical protein
MTDVDQPLEISDGGGSEGWRSLDQSATRRSAHRLRLPSDDSAGDLIPRNNSRLEIVMHNGGPTRGCLP